MQHVGEEQKDNLSSASDCEQTTLEQDKQNEDCKPDIPFQPNQCALETTGIRYSYPIFTPKKHCKPKFKEEGCCKTINLEDTSIPILTFQTEEEELVQSKLKLCSPRHRKTLSKRIKSNISNADSGRLCSLLTASQPLTEHSASVPSPCDNTFSVASLHRHPETAPSEGLSTFGVSTNTTTHSTITIKLDKQILDNALLNSAGNMLDDSVVNNGQGTVVTASVTNLDEGLHNFIVSDCLHTEDIVESVIIESEDTAESCSSELGETVRIKQDIANETTKTSKIELGEMMQIKEDIANETAETIKTELAERIRIEEEITTGEKSFEQRIQTDAPVSSDDCSINMETVEERQALEGPVIELGEDGVSNMDYMHVFWVDEESEVICEEDTRENSIRQITKRERDRQKKRAMRANPEYREKETAKARLRMKMRRQDPEYREQERRRDRDRRRQARSKNCA